MNIIEKVVGDYVAKFYHRKESGFDNTATDEIVIAEIFDENVYETDFDDLDGRVVLDIGANIGAYSIFCALGGATVYAFEPDNENYKMLERNIKLNGLEDNIILHKLAITDDENKHILYSGQGGSFIKDNRRLAPEAQEKLDSGSIENYNVESTTLDIVIKQIGRKIDICKVDIEGSEYAMFKKAGRSTMNSLKLITMEFHSTDEKTYGAFIAKLQRSHNIHAFGKPNGGGQVIARLY